MIFQLVVLILGIVAAVYAIRAKKQAMYYACFSIAGLNCTFLLFTGTITILQYLILQQVLLCFVIQIMRKKD